MTPLLIFIGVLFAWLARQVLGALVGQQIKGSIPDYTAHRAQSAAQKLPPDLREAYEAEWLAELATLGEKPLTAIRYANGLGRAAWEITNRVGAPGAERSLALIAARGRDVLSGATFLFLLAPVLSAIAVMALLERGSHPILARSVELGKNGKPFNRFRFATSIQVSSGEIRMTPLGRILFRLSLHELPVFINLLRGDVGLVGPPSRRPTLGDGTKPVIRKVPPGLCSWQALWARGLVDLSLEEAMHRDEHRTLRGDLVLIFRSMKAVSRAQI